MSLIKSRLILHRYLTAVDRAYYDSLSSASQRSLAFQGGPFEGGDLRGFEEDPLRDEMVSLRLWDDAAKLEGIEATTPRATAYLEMIVAHLEKQGVNGE
jgi:predicted HD phosphohydrolase